MKKQLLLPHSFRIIGFILLPIAVSLLIMVFMYDYSFPFLSYGHAELKKGTFDLVNHDFSDEAAMLLTFISLFMVAFSKERIEDEYLQKIRLKALQISVYVNYAVLVVGTVTIYGLSYLYVLYGNLFTILIIFIVVYYYKAHFSTRFQNAAHEE